MQFSAQFLNRFRFSRTTCYLFAWIIALVTSTTSLLLAWNAFADHRRPDGNTGHTQIDFGAQWLGSRMIALGHGSELYHRRALFEAAQGAYPRADEVPDDQRKPEEKAIHDAEYLVGALVTQEDPALVQRINWSTGVLVPREPLAAFLYLVARRSYLPDIPEPNPSLLSGPLYPPIQPVLMSPLGFLRPLRAYRVYQVLQILLACAAGLAIQQFSDGRIWWPIGFTGVLLYPGFFSCVALGQNSVLTLAVLTWGWALMARGRWVDGGLVWGLLAYKPVWAAAFLLVPLAMGRWRAALAMLLSSAGLAAATLPFVGWQSWFDWLEVGRLANAIYDYDYNWVFLSRDILGVPRRWLLDFKTMPTASENLVAMICGWTFLLLLVECTLRLAILRRPGAVATVGPGAAFLFLGGWLSCFHFMYYDVLLTALPIALLLAGWGHHSYNAFLQKKIPLRRFNLRLVTAVTALLIIGFLTAEFTLLLTGVFGTPWSTFVLVGLWMWCGWLWCLERAPVPPVDHWPDASPRDAAQFI